MSLPHPPRWLAPLLTLACVLGLCATRVDAQRMTSDPDARLIGVPDRSDYLPDSSVIAEVGGRVTTAGDFIRAWFKAWVPDMPPPDSAGRVEFLNSILSRDLLALEAHRLRIELAFEQRLELREYRTRMLANLLFRRAITDSVVVTDADADSLYPQFQYEVLARHILFNDPDLAARVRADLIAKRIGWEDAARRYTQDDSSRFNGGMLGWMRRADAAPVVAMEIWPLEPNVVSPVFSDDLGFHIAQVLERRPAAAPDRKVARSFARAGLSQYRTARRLEQLKDQMRTSIGLRYDEPNIEWACARFASTFDVQRGSKGAEMTFNDVMPEFTPEDTARVLARFEGGTLTLGRFLDLYSHLPVMLRPQANSPALLRTAVDGFVLEPAMADEAVARGLDRDPIAIRNTMLKREELMVGRLYEDSVAAHAWVSPKEHRKFYTKHQSAYITFPSLQYASFSFRDRAAAESLATRLRATTDLGAVFADSARYGWRAGSFRTRKQNEGGTFQKLLFEDMRPGQVVVDGPGRDGSWFVLKLVSYDPGRQLTYEQAAQYVDADIQKIRSEELLAAFVGRLKKRYPTHAHFDRVMRIRLVDPDL